MNGGHQDRWKNPSLFP